MKTPATAKNKKWLWVYFSTNFWLQIWNKNVESYGLRHLLTSVIYCLLLSAVCGWLVTTCKDLAVHMSVAAAMLWLCIVGGG